MRCSNCGEPIEEGRLFCLNCGQEVQWVPDYDSFGDYMVQEKLKKEKEQAEAAAARKRAAIAAENRRRKKAKKKRMILVSVAGVLVLVAAGLFFKLGMDKKNYNDFDYQIRMADTAFSNHKYEESYKFVERAVSLDDSDFFWHRYRLSWKRQIRQSKRFRMLFVWNRITNPLIISSSKYIWKMISPMK